MLKSILIILNTLTLTLFSWFLNPVELQINAPTEVMAGTAFEVSVTIKKGSVDGFARFQQQLPKGFTAELIDPATGDYKFEDQMVKVFWLIVPSKEEITIRYRLNTDHSVQGRFSLSGIFSYVDGDKKYAELPPFEINILPSPLANSNTDTNKVVMETQEQIVCKRSSVNINSAGEVEIGIIVNRGTLSVDQFAKIQETVPAGYQALSMETKGGIFTFQNNVAKFLWMTLPAEQEFEVKYKLVPNPGVQLAKLDIKGNFSYINNGQTVEVPLTEAEKTVNQLVAEQLAFQHGDIKTEPIAQVEPTKTEEPVKEPIAEVVENTNQNLSANKEETLTTQISKTPTPDTKVSYRVQIAAGHQKIQVKTYFAKLKVTESVQTESLDGWLKYTVGRYEEYLQARNKRNDIWNQTPIRDAFVTAYNQGKRITVQEALMISNQTWHQ